MNRKKILEKVSDFCIERLVSRALRHSRKNWLEKGRRVGFGLYRLGYRRKICSQNLQIAMGDSLDEASFGKTLRDSYRNLGAVFYDSLYLYALSQKYEGEELEKRLDWARIDWEAAPELKRLFKHRQKAVIFLTSHHSNIFAGMFLGRHFEGFHSMGRIHKNALSNRIDNALRGLFGMKVLAISKSRPKDLFKAMRALRNRNVLMFASDQADRDSDLEVPFFGKTATFPVGVGKMAVQTACDVYFLSVRMGKDAIYEIRPRKIEYALYDDPMRTRLELARRYNAMLEELIRENPDQYMWIHKRWKPGKEGGVLQNQTGFDGF